MGRQIPNSVVGATASVIGHHYHSHSKLDTLFMESGAPGEPPAGNCESKCASCKGGDIGAYPGQQGLVVKGLVPAKDRAIDLATLSAHMRKQRILRRRRRPEIPSQPLLGCNARRSFRAAPNPRDGTGSNFSNGASGIAQGGQIIGDEEFKDD